jgi:lysozyme
MSICKRFIALFVTAALGAALTGCAVTEPRTTVQVGGQTVVVDESLEQSGFSEEDFSTDPDTGRVTCLSRVALTGIDISSHQGEIDWTAVAGDGIDFAMLRVGKRGYSEGAIGADSRFEENYTAAVENGLEVGAYFFSQAISVEEAEEEAQFVLDTLNGRNMDLPVVFDWEQIVEDEARTDDVDTETVTACALAFCQRIQEGGYSTAVYFNASLGYIQYDYAQLSDLDSWYAQYDGSWPTFAYSFDLWQYSKSGTVAGIGGNVDMDLYFLPVVE